MDWLWYRFRLGSFSEICETNDAMFRGNWTTIEPHIEDQPSYQYCPETDKNLFGTVKFHREKYSQPRYTAACFTPHKCRVFGIVSLVKMIRRLIKEKTILFVGDSLNGQRYLSAQCFIEELLWYNAIKTNLVCILFIIILILYYRFFCKGYR